jgi:hypothetical protein
MLMCSRVCSQVQRIFDKFDADGSGQIDHEVRQR